MIERHIDGPFGTMTISIGFPLKDDRYIDEYTCSYKIESGYNYNFAGSSRGADGLQAIFLCFQTISDILNSINDENEKKIKWHEVENFDILLMQKIRQ